MTLSEDDVVEFTSDAKGTYVLELAAPDGTHQQTIRVFEDSLTDAGPPRVTLDGSYDSSGEQFSLSASAHTAPSSDFADDRLSITFQADNRDALTNEDISVNGSSATVPESAVSGTARIHVVAHGDDGVSIADAVELDAENGAVVRLNDQPDWIKNTTVYEIFVRGFAGTEQARTDFAFLEEKVSYLADLGVGAVWLTPILEAHSTYTSGGPWLHGYNITNYFQTAADLRRNGSFKSFVDSCHDNGIKVIFDLVINHTSRQHPFFQDAKQKGTASKYYDWYDRNDSGKAQYFYGWGDIVNLNYGNMAVREHMLSVVEYWAEIVDGFRCDVAFGVPHSFWKDVRTRVKATDPDFMLLDETIPYDPDFNELEHDLHFDHELFSTLRNVGSNSAAARNLYDAITHRTETGFPENAQFLQYIENHDVSRYLDISDKSAQKAAAAATFTLPGTPMVYYGQERGVGADPSGGSQARDGMPWTNYDENLLTFYRDLINLRNAEPVLQSNAALVNVGFNTKTDDVVAFGRRASSEKGVVVLNFADDPQDVELSGMVGSTDAFTGHDISTPTNDETDTTIVRVDTVAVLPAEELDGLGEPIAVWSDEVGDDYGPGDYTYPTADPFYDRAFDIKSFGIYKTAEYYQFRFQIAGGVENPWNFSEGFSHQFIQIYMRDPNDTGGSTTARTGVNAEFTDDYQYRLVANGEIGGTIETADGSVVTDDVNIRAIDAIDSIIVEFPKSAVDLTKMDVAPLLLGYDGYGTGHVREVHATQSGYFFGGGTNDGTDPNVIDMITPSDVNQSEALDTSTQPPEIPFVDIRDTSAPVVLITLDPPEPNGDPYGKYEGTYYTPVTVTVSAKDTGSTGVESVEYKIDDSSWEKYTEPITIEAEGKYTVSVRATDEAGNTSSVKTAEFEILNDECPGSDIR